MPQFLALFLKEHKDYLNAWLLSHYYAFFVHNLIWVFPFLKLKHPNASFSCQEPIFFFLFLFWKTQCKTHKLLLTQDSARPIIYSIQKKKIVQTLPLFSHRPRKCKTIVRTLQKEKKKSIKTQNPYIKHNKIVQKLSKFKEKENILNSIMGRESNLRQNPQAKHSTLPFSVF